MAKPPAFTVEQARATILRGVEPIADIEHVALMSAAGRVLAAPLLATLTQPPFAASAMDGYAVRAIDVTSLPARLKVVGEAAAGHALATRIGPGEAARIFTGAPLPDGADAIVIQENTTRDGDRVSVVSGEPDAEHVRPRAGDFSQGEQLLTSGRRLGVREITIAAAAGHPQLAVRRKPRVALLATGDELVLPGTTPRPDQIVCSNPYGVAALVAAAGGEPHFLGIAADTPESLDAHIARAADADVLVTLGGASVGDHDLVGPVLQARGLSLAFWKIAMRPGRPLMFGALGQQCVLGLPGNPVSSLITARLFLVPLIHALLGLPAELEMTATAFVATALPANGPRAHYMRATKRRRSDGALEVEPVRSQDSSLLSPLIDADCLIVRSIGAPAVAAGSAVSVLPLDL
jgi:molybdopterin molybdotransferase